MRVIQPLKLIGLLLLSVGSAQVNAAETPLIDLFANALTCKTDIVDPRDPKVLAFLSSQGVKVTNNEPEGLPDFTFTFKEPLQILGTAVRSAHWAAGSGGIFYAEASGSLNALMQQAKVSAATSPQNIEELGYGRMSAQFYQDMPQRPELDEFPPKWVMGEGQGSLQWGCRYFD